MSSLTIFTDLPLESSKLEAFKDACKPDTLVQARNPVTSVLAKAERDPAFLEAEIALGQPDLESIYASEKLQWIQVTSAGFTRYDTPEFRSYAAKRGLIVTNSSAVFDEPCAVHALSFLLAQERALMPSLQKRIPNGAPEWTAIRQQSGCLHGKRILILGYGAIAKRLQALLSPFQIELLAFRRQAKGDEGVPIVNLESLPAELSKADYVINILPENSGSLNFMDATRFAQMKQGSTYVNIGRGTTNDQNALAEALSNQHLASAWLDVTNPEPLPDDHALWKNSNCFITPHTAGGHGDEVGSLIRHFLSNLAFYKKGLPLKNKIL